MRPYLVPRKVGMFPSKSASAQVRAKYLDRVLSPDSATHGTPDSEVAIWHGSLFTGRMLTVADTGMLGRHGSYWLGVCVEKQGEVKVKY